MGYNYVSIGIKQETKDLLDRCRAHIQAGAKSETGMDIIITYDNALARIAKRYLEAHSVGD